MGRDSVSKAESLKIRLWRTRKAYANLFLTRREQWEQNWKHVEQAFGYAWLAVAHIRAEAGMWKASVEPAVIRNGEPKEAG